MKLFLISNNLLFEEMNYNRDADLDTIRMVRPLSTTGEIYANKIGNSKMFSNVSKIYTSMYASSIDTAKYLARNLDLNVYLEEKLNECKVGILGSKNMKMVKGLQDHEFAYKLSNGESLIDVGNRIDSFVNQIILENEDCALFTHKRAIVGFLLKYSQVGYNLDENLILTFNNEVIYDDTETDLDIYELEIEENKIIKIESITDLK